MYYVGGGGGVYYITSAEHISFIILTNWYVINQYYSASITVPVYSAHFIMTAVHLITMVLILGCYGYIYLLTSLDLLCCVQDD